MLNLLMMGIGLDVKPTMGAVEHPADEVLGSSVKNVASRDALKSPFADVFHQLGNNEAPDSQALPVENRGLGSDKSTIPTSMTMASPSKLLPLPGKDLPDGRLGATIASGTATAVSLADRDKVSPSASLEVFLAGLDPDVLQDLTDRLKGISKDAAFPTINIAALHAAIENSDNGVLTEKTYLPDATLDESGVLTDQNLATILAPIVASLPIPFEGLRAESTSVQGALGNPTAVVMQKSDLGPLAVQDHSQSKATAAESPLSSFREWSNLLMPHQRHELNAALADLTSPGPRLASTVSAPAQLGATVAPADPMARSVDRVFLESFLESRTNAKTSSNLGNTPGQAVEVSNDPRLGVNEGKTQAALVKPNPDFSEAYTANRLPGGETAMLAARLRQMHKQMHPTTIINEPVAAVRTNLAATMLENSVSQLTRKVTNHPLDKLINVGAQSVSQALGGEGVHNSPATPAALGGVSTPALTPGQSTLLAANPTLPLPSLSNVDAANLHQQVMRVISDRRVGQESMTVQLSPASLGSMEIKFNKDGDGEVNITIVAREHATRDLLDQFAPRVRQLLQDAGVSVGAFDVQGEGAWQNRGDSARDDSEDAEELAESVEVAQHQISDAHQGFYVSV